MHSIQGIVEFPVTHEEFTFDVLGERFGDKIAMLADYAEEHPNLRDVIIILYTEWVVENIDTIKKFDMLSIEHFSSYVNIIVGIDPPYCIKINWPCESHTERLLYSLATGDNIV